MKKILFLFFIGISFNSFSQKYNGNELLSVLGQVKDSSDIYKAFAREWGMGRKTSNPEKGIKVNKNSETGQIIAISFAGKGYELGDVKFQAFTGTIPFALSVADNYESLRNKLGAPKKDYEKVSKFSKNGLSIIVTFKNTSKSKIEVIKIALGFGQTEYNPADWEVKETPSAAQQQNNEPTEQELKSTKENSQINVQPSKPADSAPAKPREEPAKQPAKERPIITETMPATFDNKPKSTPPVISSSKSDFYKTVMEVMEAGAESNYESVQVGELNPIANTWNYKYTYKTNVTIPGTSYNFVYRFPFATSQKDWVAVIKEGNYDESFKTVYNEFLAKIKKEFPTSEGWKYNFPVDEDPNFPLKDFEAQNNKFGSVVLDYHKIPSGKSVLYLRLLVYYD